MMPNALQRPAGRRGLQSLRPVDRVAGSLAFPRAPYMNGHFTTPSQIPDDLRSQPPDT